MTETFSIIPRQAGSSGTALLVIVVLGVALLAVLGAGFAFVHSVSASRTARFEVSSEGLRLRGDFYGRLIPAAQLRTAGARAVDLTMERSLQPTVRTMGTALPGYQGGWFRLRNGEKGLLYVTDKSRVAYVPTTAGYSVLLSVADPGAFVAALRKAAAPGM